MSKEFKLFTVEMLSSAPLSMIVFVILNGAKNLT